MKEKMKFKCWDCKKAGELDISILRCHYCSSEWIEPLYDYKRISKITNKIFNGTIDNLWKYIDLLPIFSEENIVSFGEGGVPLIKAKNLNKKYKIDLYIKDEGVQFPTFTFKNRGGALAVSGLKQEGYRKVALYSTGNIGLAFSYYCKKAGIEAYIFCPRHTPQDKIEEMKSNGAKAFVIDGSYAVAADECRKFAKNNKIYLDPGVKSIYRRASKKTIAYEVFEQLNKKAPRWYFQSVSGGLGPLGFYTAFKELKIMGLVNRMPSIGCVQVNGCNPMHQSFIKNTDEITIIDNPTTDIITLATGNPISYPYVYKVVKATDGIIESVNEEECYEMVDILNNEEGVISAPPAAAALVGIVKLAKNNFFRKDEGPIVYVMTGRK